MTIFIPYYYYYYLNLKKIKNLNFIKIYYWSQQHTEAFRASNIPIFTNAVTIGQGLGPTHVVFKKRLCDS